MKKRKDVIMSDQNEKLEQKLDQQLLMENHTVWITFSPEIGEKRAAYLPQCLAALGMEPKRILYNVLRLPWQTVEKALNNPASGRKVKVQSRFNQNETLDLVSGNDYDCFVMDYLQLLSGILFANRVDGYQDFINRLNNVTAGRAAPNVIFCMGSTEKEQNDSAVFLHPDLALITKDSMYFCELRKSGNTVTFTALDTRNGKTITKNIV